MKKELWIITTELPLPTFGKTVRTYNIIKQFVDNGFNIVLFSCVNNYKTTDLQFLKKNLNITIKVAKYSKFGYFKQLRSGVIKRVIPYMEEYRSSNISDVIIKNLNNLEPKNIIFDNFNSYYSAQKAINLIEQKYPKINIILNEQNVEYSLFDSSLVAFNFFKRIIGKHILSNIRRLEINALLQADIVFVCSKKDKTIISKHITAKNIILLPNGVDTLHFKPVKKKAENAILFIGKLDYTPNLIGLKYFIKNIYSLLDDLNCKFYIIGKNPPKWLINLEMKNPNIIVVGFVSDVREYLNRVNICVCPLLNGSGTRLKILEYMSTGKAVVSTTKGAEGIDGINKTNIILADKPYEFANSIKLLFSDLELIKNLGSNARKLVVKNYDWNITTEVAVKILNKLSIKE